jgi:sialic acid synthase SpsE
MTNSSVTIDRYHIGEEFPPFVIAEAGINHEGDVRKAVEMVDAAAAAGADCIKFQCHITESEMVKTNMCPGNISAEPLWDIIKRCELTEEEERKVQARCKDRGILFLSTPFSREASDRLEMMGVHAYKIGSGECNNLPLIEHIARKGKPIILSTGMNDLQSVRRSVAIIKEFDVPLILTHCTSMYPTPYSRVRLGAITELKQAFNVPVGLSDHSLGIYTCLGAVALGASVLEKHFTISREWPGPDISLSITPDELKDLVKGARAIFEARGGSKSVLDEEQPVIDFAYASVCTIRDVKKGDVFSLDTVWAKRPGTGEIHASKLKMVLGRKAAHDIPFDKLLTWNDIE